MGRNGRKAIVCILIYLTLFSSCVKFPSNILRPSYQQEYLLRQKVSSIALESVGKKVLRSSFRVYERSCTDFVFYVFDEAGIDIRRFLDFSIKGKMVKVFYYSLKNMGYVYREDPPKVGDIIFFDNTFDANRNGVWDDLLTHVGIVVNYEKGTGRVVFVHYGLNGVEIAYMTRKAPYIYAIRKSDGSLFILNSFIRRKRGNEMRERYFYLSAPNFHSYGDFISPHLFRISSY